MGARVEAMPAALHDQIYAYVSHLPHLLAFAAVKILPPEARRDPQLSKFLRLGQANPQWWAEVLVLNQTYLLKALDRYLDVAFHIKNELAQAPEETHQHDSLVAHSVLFPRIAASCLVTTVIEAERLAGVPFARFAGDGFTDFVMPATTAPEGDMEQISGQSMAVAALLNAFVEKLAPLRALIASGDLEKLQQALA